MFRCRVSLTPAVAGRFELSPTNRPNPSCVLTLRRNEVEADLLVWESGEAELAIIESGGSINQQHFADIRTPPDLSTILSNLVYSVSARQAPVLHPSSGTS